MFSVLPDVGPFLSDLAGYKWSSFGAYVGRRRGPGWLTTATILATVGDAARYDYLVTTSPKSTIEQVYDRQRWPLVLNEESEPGT